ncbi:DNA polymerase beta subunit [Desulfurococcaceae archaeon AG1]|jgi:predicted nucleotidyltransferase|nr:MAG: DNA polymerase III subunit beta [Desulfurococcaceae archaeon]GAY25600.1 DNA polymerase beta subunit [Desulfurococcaceae archaeon AG1]
MSWEEFLVREAKRRAEIFSNLDKYLRKIVEIVTRLDPGAEVYLFGSVAEDRHLLSSDIDVLVVTKISPGEVLASLWREGIKDPFEIHVITADLLDIYKRRAKLIRISPANNR